MTDKSKERDSQEPSNQEDTRIFYVLEEEDWLDLKVLATEAVIKGPENLDETTLVKARFIKTLGNLAGRKTALTEDERFQEVREEEVDQLAEQLSPEDKSKLMFEFNMWRTNDNVVDGLRIKRGDEVK